MEKAVYVRLSDVDNAALNARATAEDRDKSYIVRRAIRVYLKMKENDPGPTKAELLGLWFLKIPKELRQVLTSVAEQAGHRLPDIPGLEGNQRKPPAKAKRPRS